MSDSAKSSSRRASNTTIEKRAIKSVKKDIEKELNRPLAEPTGFNLKEGDDVDFWEEHFIPKRWLEDKFTENFYEWFKGDGADATVVKATEKAVQIRFVNDGGSNTAWFPRSIIGQDGHPPKGMLYNDGLKKYAKAVGVKIGLGQHLKTETIKKKITEAGHKVPTYEDFGITSNK